MALDLLKNKINSLALSNNTFALTPTDMAKFDSSAAYYTLNQLYSSLLVALQASAITTVRDATNGALVFIPNARTLKSLIPSLGASPQFFTPTVQNAPPAPFTQYTPINTSSNFTSIAFTNNTQQMLYGSMNTNILQDNNYVSFWLKDYTQVFLGTVNDNNYAGYLDGIQVGSSNGVTRVSVSHTWLQNGVNTVAADYVNSIYTNSNAFNHFVIGVGSNRHCYVNGNLYPYTTHTGGQKPYTQLPGFLTIGRQQYLGQTAASVGKIKNVSIFNVNYNTGNIMETFYALGENGDPRSININPYHYWPLKGNTVDVITNSALANQFCNYVF